MCVSKDRYRHHDHLRQTVVGLKRQRDATSYVSHWIHHCSSQAVSPEKVTVQAIRDFPDVVI